MEIEVQPANIKTVKVRLRKKGAYKHAIVTFPRDVVERYDLQDGEHVVMCYIGKADESPEKKKTE